MSLVVTAGPRVEDESVTIRVHDPDHRLSGVRLHQELRRPRNEPLFEETEEGWEVTWPRLGADRLEYMIELLHADGTSETMCDPTNPLTAPGPFGAKSVIEFPGYEQPDWTGREPADPGRIQELPLPSSTLRTSITCLLWSSKEVAPGTLAPLLVVHDGPEMAEYSGLLRLMSLRVEDGMLPPLRVALLPPPGDRNQTYSASAAYARALTHEFLPALSQAAPVPPGRSGRVAMGASLGALAALHVHRTNPASFGGLFLQSGSFFRQRFDRQESGFVRFRRISRFVGTILAAEEWLHPIPVTITCGTVEENLANNRAVAGALRRQGYDLTLRQHPDAHNWISWRDVLDPHLVDLLARTWG